MASTFRAGSSVTFMRGRCVHIDDGAGARIGEYMQHDPRDMCRVRAPPRVCLSLCVFRSDPRAWTLRNSSRFEIRAAASPRTRSRQRPAVTVHDAVMLLLLLPPTRHGHCRTDKAGAILESSGSPKRVRPGDCSLGSPLPRAPTTLHLRRLQRWIPGRTCTLPQKPPPSPSRNLTRALEARRFPAAASWSCPACFVWGARVSPCTGARGPRHEQARLGDLTT